MQIDPEKVENLVFEGGGGKGVAYLGAVQALECLGLVPIKIDDNVVSGDVLPYSKSELSNGNKIQRIAGSSAGAITAFMLSMGCKGEDIAKELLNSQQFLEFFDLPRQVSRNHRDGSPEAISKQTIREVRYQDSAANMLKKDNKHTGALKGTEIEVNNEWHKRKQAKAIPKFVYDSLIYYFDLQVAIDTSDLLSSILNRKIGEDELKNYLRFTEMPDTAAVKDAIRNDCIAHLQLTGGLFPGRQIRFFFHRLLFRHLYKIDENIIDLMLQQHPRTRDELTLVRNYIFNNFINAQANIRIARLVEIKRKQGTRLESRAGLESSKDQLEYAINQLIDVYANINLREFFYITGVDLSLTGTNTTRMVPRIFSHAYTPLMPVCEAVAISMNIPFLFSPVIIEGNVMDEPQYKALLDSSKVPRDIKINFPYTEYNKFYKGAYADGGMINNYPIQLLRNSSRQAFAEFLVPEQRFSTSVNQSINKTFGFRLKERGSPPDTGEPIKLQDHLSVMSYLGNVMGSLQFFSEMGQLIDQDAHNATVDIDVGKIGTLDFTPNQKDARDPILKAFRAALRKVKGVSVDSGGVITTTGFPSAEKINEHQEKLDALIAMLPRSKESVSRGN